MRQGQQVNNKNGDKSSPPPPMTINMQAYAYIPFEEREEPLLTPVSLFTINDFANAFVNLRAVHLLNEDPSMGAIFVQFTKLPHLFDLYLESSLPQKDAKRRRPVQTGSRRRCSQLAAWRWSSTRTTRGRPSPFEVVFPAMKLLYISLSFGRCSSCEWRPRLPPQNTGHAEQCVRRLVTPFFASARNRPQLGEVIAHADDRYQQEPLIDFTVHAFEE
ncbi:hypothetical protein TYRP_022856 [Tyrophagus putrescentiae]|nr:hypothetical protein TYRP_022856 [Tyrophagus putrescentiae]